LIRLILLDFGSRHPRPNQGNFSFPDAITYSDKNLKFQTVGSVGNGGGEGENEDEEWERGPIPLLHK
jgi:hypothetical protein